MEAAERTETAKLTLLPMGSPIPDWLLSADPQVAGAPKGNWRFDCDVSIIELQDDFIVFPVLEMGVVSTCSILDLAGMQHHHWYAATKPVRIVHMFNSAFPFEYTAAVQAKQKEIADRAAAQVQVFAGGGGPVAPSAEQVQGGPILDRGSTSAWLWALGGFAGGVVALSAIAVVATFAPYLFK